MPLPRTATRRPPTEANFLCVYKNHRIFVAVATPVENIDLPPGVIVNDDCIDPVLQRRATAMQPTSEIVTRAGRKNRECCGRIDRSWEDVEIVLEFEEAFSRFAERAVTSNDDNSLSAGS